MVSNYCNFILLFINYCDVYERDTAGQEQFRAITKSYYRGAEAVVLVYDVTNKSSFDKLNSWIDSVVEDLVDNNIKNIKIPFYLMGNKIDLIENRVVDAESGQAFSNMQAADRFFEVSAKTGSNISQAFKKLAEDILLANNPELVSDYVSAECVIENDLQSNCFCKCYCEACTKCECKSTRNKVSRRVFSKYAKKPNSKKIGLKSTRSIVRLASEIDMRDKSKCSDCKKL
ncbi:DgyrCDS1032 [Dimorphilus gyrociliatus]|uniref:DgyrCDS1032 n=1 Tax=Dimorphilus gyrociliatus TaxID=2664684 RepID=A0A7I8V624_9ANNE|nr:DgyrCDS1032 [Dimorphilus gyrociliatus]